MKIARVTPMVMGTAWRNLTFVKVETDDGLIGVGEARAVNRTDGVLGYLNEAVPRYVLGEDPFNVERLVSRMFREDFARAGFARGHRLSRTGRPAGTAGPVGLCPGRLRLHDLYRQLWPAR